MKLNDFIESYKPELTMFMNEYFEKRKKDHSEIPFYEKSLEQIKTFSTSGKMLRGLFIVLTYSFFKPLEDKTKAAIFSTAAAMECIQSSLLIHDDIIDNDRTRRNKKTIFAQYEDDGKAVQMKDAETYGKNMGICAGDIAMFTAFDLLSRSTTNATLLQQVTSLFARETHIVALGEMIDVDMAAQTKEPTIEEIINMYKYKTARYSFSLPFEIGAILGEEKAGDISCELSKIGEHVGILFQIQDDWLGIFGDEKITGKPVGSDLREHKKTVYRAALIAKLSQEERASIDTISVEETIALIKKYNIEEEINTLRKPYENNAKEIISALPFTDAQKEVLLEIVTLVTNRSK